MPYDPISGQFNYGGESYNAPTMGVGMTMQGMGAVGADIPLAFRLMENMPGITSAAAFNARRFSNTMFRGGFLDVEAGASAKKIARARKFGGYVGDSLESVSPKGFFFSKYRNTQKLAKKSPFLKPSRLNNFSPRPRIFNRFSSVSTLSGMPNAGYYTPFQGAHFMGSLLEKAGVRKRLVAKGVISANDSTPLLAGGTLGRITTMSKAAFYEKRGAVGKLAGLDRNLSRTFGYNIMNPTVAIDEAMNSIGVSGAKAAAMRAQFEQEMLPREGRLRAISDTSGGVISKSVTEFFGTAMRPTEFIGTRAYASLHESISRTLINKTAAGKSINIAGASSNATRFLAGETIDDIGKYGARSLSKLGFEALGAGERAAGMKMLGFAGGKAFAAAMPGLNAIGTAALVYDLTKMAATGIVAAGNFAKDAVKSMQGSLHKPLFGMGYQDNEVAATSRARGVMAIQNSRLNARSALGSEASLMAAHFG